MDLLQTKSDFSNHALLLLLLLFDPKNASMHTRGKSRKQAVCPSLSICCQCPNTMRSLRILPANEHDMTLPLTPLLTLGGIHCWSGIIQLWSHQISIVPLCWRVERSIDSNYHLTLQTTRLLCSSLLVAICMYTIDMMSLLFWPFPNQIGLIRACKWIWI